MDETLELKRIAEEQLGVPSSLRDYQWDGVAFLYKSSHALLADEMGLGKTVQTSVALALLLNGQNDISRVLIVAPASLVRNWMAELAMWAPLLAIRLLQGTAKDRRASYLLPIPVLVGSYEQIRMDSMDQIPSNTFDLVVLDEAQRIKNKNSTTSLACRLLPRKRSWALSATPLENSREDVVSILNFLDPSSRVKYQTKGLGNKLETVMLRRKKSEVRSELPPVIIQDLKLDLTQVQRTSYEELWTNRVSQIIETGTVSSDVTPYLFEIITRLKIVCNFVANHSSKLDALKEIVESAGNTARILVFSQFVETLLWVSQRIDTTHDLLTGSNSLTERQFAINQFKNRPTPRLLLASLKAGGVGLNLDEASHVVLFDRWWNPAVEQQAIYRAHRFNRQDSLHVVRFLIVNSIEEHITRILDDKEKLFDGTIESIETVGPRFTKEEMLQMLDISIDDKFQET